MQSGDHMSRLIFSESVLGHFCDKFKEDFFRANKSDMLDVFRESRILNGVQAYLLYLNLPDTIIQFKQ